MAVRIAIRRVASQIAGNTFRARAPDAEAASLSDASTQASGGPDDVQDQLEDKPTGPERSPANVGGLHGGSHVGGFFPHAARCEPRAQC